MKYQDLADMSDVLAHSTDSNPIMKLKLFKELARLTLL